MKEKSSVEIPSVVILTMQKKYYELLDELYEKKLDVKTARAQLKTVEKEFQRIIDVLQDTANFLSEYNGEANEWKEALEAKLDDVKGDL